MSLMDTVIHKKREWLLKAANMTRLCLASSFIRYFISIQRPLLHASPMCKSNIKCSGTIGIATNVGGGEERQREREKERKCEDKERINGNISRSA